MVEFRMLGSLELVGDDGSAVRSVLAQPKRLAILAYLALATPRGFHRRDILLALFWPESDEARARGALNQALYQLRRSLGDELLPGRGDEEVGLAWNRWWCDAVEFRSLIATDRLADALRLYRGEPLPGFAVDASAEFERWLDAERRAIRAAASAAAAKLAARCGAAGNTGGAIEWLRRAREIEPYEAEYVLALMQQLQRSGHGMAALAEYERFAARVASDLETTPPEPLAALARRLRTSADPVGVPSSHAVARTEAPAQDTAPADAVAAPTPRRLPVAFPVTERRRTAVAAAAAILLLAASLAAYAIGRNAPFSSMGRGAPAELDLTRELVLAEFVNRTEEENLSEGITEAFRIDLGQSRAFTLASTPRIQEALWRMHRPADTRLTPELARELAVREGLEAVLSGEVAMVGSHYVITAELVTADSGRVLFSHRESARAPDDVIQAVDRLSEAFRKRMGESLRELRQNEPLEAVTTHSLEALKAYSAAFRRPPNMDSDLPIQLWERAIAIDSTFASAYRSLGVWLYWRGGHQARVDEVLTRAYQLRHRLTVRERLLAEGTYHHFVTHNYERAVAVFQEMLQLDERDAAALDHLAFLHFRRREFSHAIRMHERLSLVNRTNRPASNYFFSLAAVGRLADAEALLVEQSALDTTGSVWVLMLGAFRADRGDYAAADTLVRRALALAEAAGSNRAQRGVLDYLGAFRMMRGAYAEGEALFRSAADLYRRTGARSADLILAGRLAGFDLFVAHAPERARRRLDAALQRLPLDSLPPADRPYVFLAGWYAWLGDTARVAGLLRSYEESGVAGARMLEDPGIHTARALLRAHQARFAEAWDALEEGARHSACHRCLLPAKATLYEMQERPDSVIAAWEAFVTDPYPAFGSTPFFLAHAYERLGELYDQNGQQERAVFYYRKILDLWGDPDPFLRSRVEAVRQRLQAASGRSLPRG